MVNNLVVYSLSCQPSRWIYQPCKASFSGLQLLLIRLARTRIRLAFQRISCISDWQWQLRCKVNAEASSLGLRWAAARSRRCIFITTAKLRKIWRARKFPVQNPPFLRGIFRANFARKSEGCWLCHYDLWLMTFCWFLFSQVNCQFWRPGLKTAF